MKYSSDSARLDRIEITGLEVMAIVGALDHERLAPQPLRVDLSLHVDLRDAGRSDDLADTAHYGEVTERVAEVVGESEDALLERLADRAAEVAIGFDRVEAVDVVLTKLRPPIPAVVETTSVQLHRRQDDYGAAPAAPHRAILALGSNLGDREWYLRSAIEQLAPVVSASHVFETAPVGGPDQQGAYLNMVIAVDTILDPYALLRRCNRVEAGAQRQRVVRWGPRTLDVDVLFYDDITIDDAELTVPHPRIGERRFVLAPLSQVDPDRCPPDWQDELPPLEMTDHGELPGIDELLAPS